ncbi:hypothetical protein T265_09090 [Opisthorchis viverrini]|uniref:Uncharacterized protein n=1 Tax=Opisthorchis viverrini TaxID=6198 RepID=A0A074Z745_OPIVI|nr:hypothetical protein T265_09090 [Opisthorchis viverrini]KER22918.1 hypothetical protein T265_09090 [Opisthorchis viverrini]
MHPALQAQGTAQLGTVQADSDGHASWLVENTTLKLWNLIGRSVVLHDLTASSRYGLYITPNSRKDSSEMHPTKLLEVANHRTTGSSCAPGVHLLNKQSPEDGCTLVTGRTYLGR